MPEPIGRLGRTDDQRLFAKLEFIMSKPFAAVCLILFSSLSVAQDNPTTGESPVKATDDAATPADTEMADGEKTELSTGLSNVPQKPDLSEMPPEFFEERKQAGIRFEELRTELAEKLIAMRKKHTRYQNHEVRNRKAANEYYELRNECRNLMNQLLEAAINYISYSPDDPQAAATYVLTMVEHCEERNIYNRSTLEASARLIDGGIRYKYLFREGLRSALSVGHFDLAEKLYEAVEPAVYEDTDHIMMGNLDLIKQQWESEVELYKKELEEDRLPRVKMKTTRGDLLIELYLDHAPSTVSHFISMVEDGYFDNIEFYQVVDNILALAGNQTDAERGYNGKFLEDEHTRSDARAGTRGSLVMAKVPMGDTGSFIPNSASSQFAILYLPNSVVNSEQTVFGRVIEGMDVVGDFRRVDPNKKKEKNAISFPADRIIEATVVRRPETLPEPRYVDIPGRSAK